MLGWVAQPAPPGRSSTLMPLVVTVPISGPVPLPAGVAGPPGRVINVGVAVLTANSVANGVPRVSGDRPRLGWKVLTKSRSAPVSFLASLTASVASTLKPSVVRSPQPPTMEARWMLPPPCSVMSALAEARRPLKSVRMMKLMTPPMASVP